MVELDAKIVMDTVSSSSTLDNSIFGDFCLQVVYVRVSTIYVITRYDSSSY